VKLNVLSLFDGMACGLQALKQSGIQVRNYYASEKDKYAIQIAMKNHSDIIQLGDVNNWKKWDLPKIDLLIGGSPCQGFSFAGKQLNFKDERSKLFFIYADVLKVLKPKYFLLENVRMKKEYQDVITEHLNVEFIEINSSLVSAQNRNRLYWVNIPIKELPEDKGILLKDVVFDNKALKRRDLLLSEKAMEYMNRRTKDGRTHWDFKHHSDVRERKSAAVVANFFKGVPYNVLKDWDCVRYFDPIECERLQTLPDNYTKGVSNTQRYKMIGNGWTVSVIEHIFNHLPERYKA